jgi:probable rRNA maturation factor
VAVASAVRPRVPTTVSRRVSRALRRAAARLGVDADALAGLAVRIVDDREMARLREAHLQLPGPTDVLSFPASTADDEGELGDIVIDWDAVRRQAGGTSVAALEREAISLAVHALVHLLGHDHGTRPEARAMLRLERRAARAAGLGAVTRPYGGGH